MGTDHTAVLAGLSAPERRLLIERSDRAGLTRLAGHLGAVAVTATALTQGWTWRPALMVAHGALVGFLFTLLHETVHRTPFRSRKLNDAVGRACGFIVMIGFDWFRRYHLAHHRYTNEPGLDPELAEPRPATLRQYLWYLSGVPDWVGRLRVLVVNALGRNSDPFVSVARQRAVAREARCHLGGYLALAGISGAAGSPILLWLWLGPLVMGGPLLRAYLLAEHAGCPPSASMFDNTRTVLTNRVVRFFAWNMPYHAEHHAFPAVPFHKLADFHRHTRHHLGVVDRGYLSFHRHFVRCLRAR